MCNVPQHQAKEGLSIQKDTQDTTTPMANLRKAQRDRINEFMILGKEKRGNESKALNQENGIEIGSKGLHHENQHGFMNERSTIQ